MVMQGILQQALFRDFDVRDVVQRADDTLHFTISAEHGTGFQRDPMIAAIHGLETKFNTHPAAAML